MKLLRLAAVVLIVAVPSLVHTQSPAPPRQPSSPAPAPQATFKSGVELVRLDVRVVDDAGLPVKDLRADEVRVSEGGAPRPVVVFQHVAEPVGSYLEVARRTIGAEVSTNQGAPRGHLYVFVFDQAHISPGNEVRARLAVDRFLHTRVKPGDRVALYALPGPGPQIPFTSNINIPLAELVQVRGGLDRQSFVSFGDMSDYEAFQVLRGNDTILQRILTRASAATSPVTDVGSTDVASTVSTRAQGVTVDVSPAAQDAAKSAAMTVVSRADNETHAFLVSLSDVIRELAGIEGRKSVILVSEGFFADHMTTDVDRVAAAAAEAYAVIYSLDINRRGSDISAPAPTGADPYQEIQTRLESLGTLSAETSGELVLDASGRAEQVLNRVVDASQDYYVVGFEPPASALSDRNRYRRVKVSVTRPGVRVETRTGYALREPLNLADRRRAIDTALGAPFPQQGLPLEMTTYVLRGTSPGIQRVVMSLEADLPVASDSAAKPADVVFVARDARDGRARASGTDVIPLPRTVVQGRSTGRGQFRVQFDLPAGDYLMRAAVREPGGATGTVDRRFEVRALDGVDLTASDLIIGRRENALPVRARSYVDEGISGALEVYARNPGDLDAVDVTVDLMPVNGAEAVRSVRADLLDVRRVGNGAGRPAQILIPLNGVAAGEYVARARVRSRGETVAEVIRQVEVVGSAPPVTAAVPPERVTPKMILGGDLARRFVSSIVQTVSEPSLKAAAAQAQVGAWSNVPALLGPVPKSGTRPAEYHMLLGLAQFAGERYGESAASLDTALALQPRSAPTAFVLGWVHLNAGRAPEAITAWRNAVRVDPTMTSAYLALADTYIRLSHRELAIQILKSGLVAMPKSLELQGKLDSLERR
jgi:VWFA-related protein